MADERLRKTGTLDIEYQNEVGMGVGPTLEFYALVSEEIRRLDIWRNSGEECGLFPRPYSEVPASALSLYTFVGQFIGKAFLDNRLVDLPLSPVLWKLILGRATTFNDLAGISATLTATLTDLRTH
jgi:E3 ubiquitin-protein ligase TRIP12